MMRPYEKLLVRKAEDCLKLAEMELGKKASKSKIEDRAVRLMALTDREIKKRLKAGGK